MHGQQNVNKQGSKFCKDTNDVCVSKIIHEAAFLRSLRVRRMLNKLHLSYVRWSKFFAFCRALHWVSCFHGHINPYPANVENTVSSE